MKTIILSAITAALASCASTTFYGADGKPTAQFQGDMTRVEYQRACDGAMKWSADTVNHSAATAAGGNATSKVILSGGTAYATAGAPALIK